MRFCILLLAALVGCGGEPAEQLDAGARDASAPDAGVLPRELVLGGDRPATMIVPEGYDGTPRPLVILLHPYSEDAESEDRYLMMSSRVDERGFFLLLPNGTEEQGTEMNRFWNATDACCDFDGSGVDDVAYLLSLIDEVVESFSIGSVHAIGHSNGGFMAYRLACDAPEAFDSIVSLAGSTFFDESDCMATVPVRVLQIHGTSDMVIRYGGAPTGDLRYPGAEETAQRWAVRAGCDLSALEMGAPMDLDVGVSGLETEVAIYRSGCAPGIDVQLWTMNRAGHVPTIAPDFTDRLLDWSLAASRPE